MGFTHSAALLVAASLLLACRTKTSDRTSTSKQDEEPETTSTPSKARTPDRKAQSLVEAKRGFHTRVHDESPRTGPAPAPPPEIFTLVHYTSSAGELAAYVTPKPTDGRKRPAIVWLQGGFDPSIDASAWQPAPADNDQSARAFREAGAVLMLPARRGGNDNMKPRETFFGEVDDVIAAADFLAKLDYVDPARLYLGGHSTGGTLALLAAESTDRFRAVFSFGAVANISAYAQFATFDTSDKNEIRLRSPMFFLSNVHTPTFLFEGALQPSNVDQLPDLTPKGSSVPIHVYRVDGVSHFSILSPVTRLLAEKIVGSSGDVTVTDAELKDAVAKSRGTAP